MAYAAPGFLKAMNTHTLIPDDNLLPSPVQQQRQQRIFDRGVETVRNPSTTQKIEARKTTELTYLQSLALRTVKSEREEQRLEVIAKNFERRQLALMAE